MFPRGGGGRSKCGVAGLVVENVWYVFEEVRVCVVYVSMCVWISV